jgi:hypothetical protein
MAHSIMHFTHVTHLRRIVDEGGIHCDRVAQEEGLNTVHIAHQDLKVRRAQTPVPCSAGGTLCDYVPHYFAPRSPMLYSIHMGNVVGYSGGQKQVAYFVSTAEAVASAGLSFAFTDGHPVMDLSDFFDDLGDLAEVDWPLMRERYWRDTLDDPDRKRRRQAEFLVHSLMPLDLVDEVVVADERRQAIVQAAFDGQEVMPAVRIDRDFYF